MRLAKKQGIDLRQSFERLGKQALVMNGRYGHARQIKRAMREQKKLRNYLGRVIRDIERKHPEPDSRFADLLKLARRIYSQTRNDSNKVYSIHAPEVECIAKGKTHKKYEFGCKVSIVSTSKDNWIIGMQAVHGNPYDGHTLSVACSFSYFSDERLFWYNLSIPLTIPSILENLPTPVTLGDHLRRRRLELGLHQKDVAKIIGVTTSSIWNWEHGAEPELRYQPQIITFLG